MTAQVAEHSKGAAVISTLEQAVLAAQQVSVAGIKSGEAIGYRAGMLRAAAICEARVALHASYLPLEQCTSGTLGQSEIRARMAEAKALANEIRKALKEATK